MYKKYYKIIIIFFIFILNYVNFINSTDFKIIDDLYHNGKYQEGLTILENEYDTLYPDIKIIWRISRFYYEIADSLPDKNKQEKIEYYTKGMEISALYIEMTDGEKSDRAQLIFWYTACYGSKAELIGIKESLDVIPELFMLADKAIELDPAFAAPYLLLSRVDEEVPALLGGDKFRMGKNLSKAIKNNPEDISVLVESGELFLNRGWDIDKKKKMTEKNGEEDGSPKNLSDKEYAKILIEKALELFKNIDNPSVRDKNNYQLAMELLKKFK